MTGGRRGHILFNVQRWPLISREAEMASIREALAAQADGSGVLLVGASGVGKTRLVREAVSGLDRRAVVRLAGTAAGNDDQAPGNTLAKVSFSAIAGTTCSIALDGCGGQSGNATIQYTLVRPFRPARSALCAGTGRTSRVSRRAGSDRFSRFSRFSLRWPRRSRRAG